MIWLKILLGKTIIAFEKLYKGKIAYHFYCLLNHLFGKSKRISRKHINQSIYYYFLLPDLHTAYKKKIVYLIEQDKIYNGSNRYCRNYLEILNDSAMHEYLDLNINHRSYFESNIVFEGFQTINKKKKIKNLLIFGPSHDLNSSLNLLSDDSIVLLKPVDLDEKYNHYNKIVILNNAWSIGRYKTITIDWIEKNSNALIISPHKMDIKSKNIIVFDEKKILTAGTYGSPMGLQRATLILCTLFEFDSLKLLGFNFQLEETTYLDWYPSKIKEVFGSFKEGLIISNYKHDFLYNIMYLKKIKNDLNMNISGGIDYYLDLPINDLVSLYEKNRN